MRRGLAVVTVASVASAFLAAQPPQPPRPTFRTEANFVRVDVYPTRDGQAVMDLTAADFEVLEDNAPQAIQTFERVVVPLPGAQTARVEPRTVGEANTMAADPRARVFVVFLDRYHSGVSASHMIRRPLINLLDRLIGQDDLVAVMTPDMSAKDLAFARRTRTIEGMLTRYWTWGSPGFVDEPDPQERILEMCYGKEAGALIARLRLHRTLSALEDLVVHLRGLREERKAIVTITAGWTLPGPDPRLMPRTRAGQAPGIQPLVPGVDGRIATDDPRNPASHYECDTLRMRIAQLDLEREFRDLLDVANRSNATFYPVNPRGLEAGVTPWQNDAIVDRTDVLRTLADNTDGLAVVDTNDLTRGMRRIVDDLSSYYLLGYYSSNVRLDGTYRRITVRVKRPGVSVRARRGYRAATREEIAAERAPLAPAAVPVVDAGVSAALGVLSGVERASALRLAAGVSHDGGRAWVTGELNPRALAEWRAGAEIALLLTRPDGATVASGRASIAAGRRTFTSRLDGISLAPGVYHVQVRMTAMGVGPVLETVPIQVTASTNVGTPLLFRRGPLATAPFEPAADPRFRRNETLRVQASSAPDAAGAVRVTVLDRNGRALPLPVTAQALNQDGVHWIAADIPLASLAAGEYVVQIDSDGRKSLVAFRIVS